ncbi:hypothetical protein AHAT_28170 [Agarivorans sp. Toyoura001]|uniref:AraC family transcriptional regulator n=1 Tax=Agarivorans sp. Toyoura001 TaxID=2283141 RepID=UPI0010F386AA|nr:AraC family transcriptional regulator [Agarivorans sp. Toyoura001]GDY26927.1 hypothetical protein AHAT_28170 [Agarivorans sp. Toyoura001]
MTSQSERIRQVKLHIESTLDQALDIATLASLAGFSAFHFCRLFQAYVGESIYAYRKRLLLERSIKHLQYTDLALSEIAYRSGYQNQSSYNKAFKLQFAQSPNQARQQKSCIITQSEQPILSSHTPLSAAEVEVVKLPTMSVLSYRTSGRYLEAAPLACQVLFQRCEQLGLAIEDSQLIGLPHDDPSVTHSEQIRFDACLSQSNTLPANLLVGLGLQQQQLPAGTYAKLRHHGAYLHILSSYQVLLLHWLPLANYQLRDSVCLEFYLDQQPQNLQPDALNTDIYLPIQASL